MPRATTLEEATKVLDPRPLDFSDKNPLGAKAASDPAFYIPLPHTKGPEGFKLPAPIERMRNRLLASTPSTKLFLSGHVGSGKSTELSRLITEPELVKRFDIIQLRFEEQEWAVLDSSQVLFRIAAELIDKHKERLAQLDRWKGVLKTLNDRIFKPMGVELKDAATSLELNAWIVKFRQDLKLNPGLRRQFRERGETEQSMLQDLINALVDDIEVALTNADFPDQLLLVVDDLDKLRTPDQHKDLFDTNLSALIAPPLRVLYTVPTAVRFGDDVRAEIRQNVEDLFPMRVLRKAPGIWNPEDAYTDERIGFFETLVGRRVEPGLVEPEAIRLAAIYSGGVLRDFFRLLRAGILLALYNDMQVVDGVAMRYAVEEERRHESIGLYGPDYEALVHVHRTNDLVTAADRRYLALSRVIESFNGTVWFDANPILWHALEEHMRKANGEPGSA